MATVSPELVKKLRQMSGAGILNCQKALTETQGDLEKAIHLLRERGIAQASKKATRAASDGSIVSYIHPGGKLGVLVEINCETDFVARTDEFQSLAKELALQVAGANPLWVKKEDIPPEIIEKEKEIYKAQVLKEGKSEKVVDKIVEGKLDKFYHETCLLEQPYVRDASGKTSVKDLINQTIAKLGENIVVRRFVRYRVAEES